MIWLWVTIAVVIDGALALVAGLLPERWLVRWRAPMLGFATGTLLASGLGEILPEALERSGALALASAAAAMAGLGAIEWTSSRRRSHVAPIVPAALLGSDALHNLGDGVAIAAAFVVDPSLGAITTGAVVLHELPEEIADYALLRATGMSRRRALVALALVQLTAGIGAAVTLLASIDPVHGPILGVACGMFVYIAAIDLLPELIRSRSPVALLAIPVGAAIVLAL